MEPLKGAWSGLVALERCAFTCGYCGRESGSKEGWVIALSAQHPPPRIYVCGTCNWPLVFVKNFQYPPPPIGRPVDHLPQMVEQLWQEARDAARAGAYSAAGMVARSLIMHVAVEKTAPADKSFAFYVKWLADNHHVPVGAHAWVDRIRQLGNEATHEITVLSRQQAEEALTFTEALLRMTYELPGRLPKLT